MTGLQMNTLSNTDCWRPTDTQMPQDGKIKDGASNPQDDGRKVNGKEECQTCKQRKYQDGSDESDVSFKSAAHVSPESAGAAVRAHENQKALDAGEFSGKNINTTL